MRSIALRILLCLMALGSVARADLKPSEVLVVVNANAPGSEALGKYYCLSRQIETDRLLVLQTDPAYSITRSQYESTILEPIRNYLTKNELRGKIRLIQIIWGVPVRVLGTEMTAEQKQVVATYKAYSDKLTGRMAIDLQFLKTVAEKFPAPRTTGLTPLGDLFEAGASALPKDLDFDALSGEFNKELPHRQTLADALPAGAGRDIAQRQLAALRLDVQGLRQYSASPSRVEFPGRPSAEDLQKEMAHLQQEQEKLPVRGETVEIARQTGDIMTRLTGVIDAHNFCQARASSVDTSSEDASVDSELALLWRADYSLAGWQPNPMFWRAPGASLTDPANLVIMTARLDGPAPRDALRMLKDCLETEQTGLEGKLYIDAGGKYPQYDKNLEALRDFVQGQTKLPVVYDSSPALFASGSCPQAALYVGWYSLQKYVPAFFWKKGSVGWHIASLEAMHLRSTTSEEWCPKLIHDEHGIGATLGAVNEPFLSAFPLPQDFFPLLLTGHYTLAECYWKTVPHTSWRLTLIGDGLYNPYRLRPALSVYQLPPQMVGQDLPLTGQE